MKVTANWIIVGLGLQGERLMKAIQSSKKSTLVASTSHRVRGSYRRALKDKRVDAVAISSRNDQHLKDVQLAARAGKHILCEKPLTPTMKDVPTMERAVRAGKKKFFVVYHLRMHPEVQKAREAIARGALGRIKGVEMEWSIGGLAKGAPKLPTHMSWREDPKKSGGGALMARGVHLFDLLRFLTGEEVMEMRAWSDADKKHVDKTAVALCALSGGASAFLTTSKVMPNADNRIVLYGTKKTLTLRKLFRDEPHAMYVRVFDAFAEALAGKKTALATFEDGKAGVALADAFNKSARTGKAVRVR